MKIAMHEDVADRSHFAKLGREVVGQRTDFDQATNGRRVVRRIQSLRRRNVRSDVQGVLRAELKAALDCPATIVIRVELARRCSGVAPEVAQSRAQRRQVAPNDGGIGLSGGHGAPSDRTAECRAASIFASCGTKSQ